MIMSAATLAVLTVTGFSICYSKLPRKIRRFIQKHTLFADAFALLLTYMLLGGTLTALVAAALVGLMTSALLYISNNPQDFLVLKDIGRVIKDQLKALKELTEEWGESYRLNHPETEKSN